jgi:hypothetical protein
MLLPAVVARADEGSSRAEAEVRLSSGILARYAYHFDRNALAASRRAGDALVALTDSGNLLRFDLATRKITREWFGPARATCLGPGRAGEILVGFEDGQVGRVDLATLAPTRVASLADKLQWVGMVTDGARDEPRLLAVVERKKWVEREGEGRVETPYSVAVDVARRKESPLVQLATTFLLDRHGRLWLGADDGEFGGWCSRWDAASGKLTSIRGIKHKDADEWEGVYRFVETRDGQVWALGGMMHMGYSSAYIRRIDTEQIKELVFFENTDGEGPNEPAENRKARLMPVRPEMPITHVIEDREGDGLSVFSHSELYRTDGSFKSWTKVLELDLHYTPGRPDAIGSYPAIRTVHRLDDPAGGMLCATGGDGYVFIAGGKTTRLALPGQLGADWITRIAATTEGTFLRGPDDDSDPWLLDGAGWRTASLWPDVPLNPGAEWREKSLLVDRDGSLITVSGTTSTAAGLRVTARWRGGKAKVLGQEDSDLIIPRVFIAPDGELWSVGSDNLMRFVGGKWQVVSALPGAERRRPTRLKNLGNGLIQAELGGSEALEVGYGVKTVGPAGPPWVLLDSAKGHLLTLSYGRDIKEPKLTLRSVSEAGKDLQVEGALAWEPGALLLATDRGLRRYEVATGRISPAPIPSPSRHVAHLERDGLGRVWLAGEGLWMASPDGKTLHSFATLPMIGRTAVAALAADPERRDGIIAALDTRGVVFVQAKSDGKR